MRIALKPVTNNPSTPDASPSKSSGSGSFLDILSQGTQDAVQGAKAAGSQAQSDRHSDNQSSSDNQTAQDSSQNISSSRAPATAPQKQASQVPTSPSGNKQGEQPASTTSKDALASASIDFAKLDSKYLLAKDVAAFAAAAPAATSSAATGSSASPAVGTSKQAGTTKSSQGKQSTTPTVAIPADASALQQALAAALPVVTVPVDAPQATFAPPIASSAAQATVPELSADGASAHVPVQAPQLNGTTANTPASTHGQQNDPGTTSAPSNQLALDRVAGTATTANAAAAALKAALSGTVLDASNLSQGSAAKPLQNSDQNTAQTVPNQPVASTFFSAAVAQNDNASAQGAGKVIPFKVAAANLAANANSTGSGTAAPSTLSANAVNSTSKNTSQDSSNSGSTSRDGGGSDGASATQNDSAHLPNTSVHADASVQPFALSATPAHATSQTSFSTASTAASPTHVSDSRNLASEPAHNPLPAGSSAINTARVIQNMNETEMRVGMRSTEFGDISIRTMVNQQQMQTQISVDHTELVSALTAHIPSVQAKLGAEYGLHASIEVNQGGASFTNQQQQSSQRDYKPFTPSAQFDGTVAPPETERFVSRSAAAALVAEGSRLDIRA